VNPTRVARAIKPSIAPSIVRTILATFALSFSSALASPAQDLFDQALYYLTFYYNGFSAVNLKNFESKYQTQLDTACQGKAETCAYDVAVKVIEAMILEIGDEHTYLVSAEDQEDILTTRSGEAESQVGTSMGFFPSPISTANGTDLRVAEVLEGSGAEEAGLLRGDRVVALNGQPLSRDSNQARDAFLQLDGSGRAVRLSVVRGANERLELTVQSRRFEFTGLPWMNISAGVARIVIPDFDIFGKIGPKLHQLVNRAQQAGVKAIVVDVRDNPGGVATECLSGVSAFVPDVTRVREARYDRLVVGYRNGVIFSRDAQERESITYEIPRPTKWTGKLSVLVNRESASCAELFASDVQFAKRGPVVGERTYGLGNTGALGFNLINGFGLYVTVSRTYRLDGTPYPDRVTPDVFVRDNYDAFIRTGRDEVFERALEVMGN
jgi:carboxyl-terminal processing protease